MRKLLIAALVLLCGVVLAGVAAWTLIPISTVGKVDFDTPLAVPPLAGSTVEDGRRIFDLTAEDHGDTWGFNGAYLGPTLRASRGEEVEIRVHNELDETTTVHWHGMHLPAVADGGPHQPIAPGDTWAPSWTIDQPAATLWYHPHPHGKTREHVRRGLAGMFILDDDATPDGLPSDYGVDDVPVIVQDRGRGLVVNGTEGPFFDVTAQRTRLRLLNASVERVYELGFSDDREFALVGTDGGLLPAPVPMTRIRLSPGERAEVVVEMAPAETVVLRSTEPELGDNPIAERFNGGSDEFDVLQLRAAEHLAASPELPAALAPAPDLDTSDARTRSFELKGRTINGDKMDMERIDETVELGTTEIWEVTNADGEHHNFHVHDVQFQVLDVDGMARGPELDGWKDTIFLAPGARVRLALQFTDYADPSSPYMFHCHLLPHEDSGMMGQFVVVEPGQSAGDLEGSGHEHH